jgi:hypothetical protein
MNTKEKEYVDKINALSKARKTSSLLYKAFVEARTAFSLANSEVSRLDAECTKMLNDSYCDTLKERETE